MLNDAEATLEHYVALAALASRLEERQRAVYEHHYSYLGFGSWSLEAGTRRHRIRFIYDGREQRLSAEAATFGDSRSVPSWERVAEHPLGGADAAGAFELVEQLVITHAAK